MIIVFRLLKYFSNISLILVLFFIYEGVSVIRTYDKGDRLKSWIHIMGRDINNFFGKMVVPLLVILLISTVCTSTAFLQIVGINNLELKPEGTYCFYVKAKNRNDKTYDLPAKIRVVKEETEYSDDKTKTDTYYYLERVYFPNGEYLDTSCLNPVTINKVTYYFDNEGKIWNITLLNKHAYSQYVTETNNASWYMVTLLLIKTVIQLIVLYSVLIYNRKNQETESGESQ
ncbi:MAG: hypothetical protein E7570_07230 [Ruminococcaceae bacterium]|nr:hypothetical protein [Oscillospiraceae bacterium]